MVLLNMDLLRYRTISILAAVCLLFLVGCKASLWSDCPENCRSDRLSVDTNLQLLKVKEDLLLSSGERTTFKVALIADSHRHVEDLDNVIGILNDRRDEIDMILFLGDLTDTGLEMEYDWVCKTLKKSDLPFFTVIGNHDLLNFGEDIWREVFGPLDYTVSFMGTKFILFDSNKLESDGAPDLEFVRQQAATTAGEVRYHTIVGAHVPPGDSSIFSDSEQDAFRDAMADAGIHLSLHGHLHHFSYDYDSERDLYEYIIARVEEDRYGILTVATDSFSLENCIGNNCETATLD